LYKEKPKVVVEVLVNSEYKSTIPQMIWLTEVAFCVSWNVLVSVLSMGNWILVMLTCSQISE